MEIRFRHGSLMLGVLGAVVLAGCTSFPDLATASLAGSDLGAEMRTPPLPDIEVDYDVRLDRSDPLGSAVSLGTNIARASHAAKAEERMHDALEQVDLPEIVRVSALADCSIVLQSDPVSSRGAADYVLDIDIQEYGIHAGSNGDVQFRLEARVHLRDVRTGDAIWERGIHLSEPVTGGLFGVPDVVTDIVNLAVLAELSVPEIARGFENLGREAARRIAHRLETDLRRERERG